MVRVKKAVDAAYAGVETVEPQPMPGSRKVRAKKVAETIPAVPEPAPAPTPAAPAVIDPPTVPPVPVKRIIKKKVPTVNGPPVAFIPHPEKELPVESVIHITVKKIEVDGRSMYIAAKEKLYDLKFKYVGRLKDDAIVPFPDSDDD